jgi:Fe-S cluster biosynthesis and repair protein YggX
MVFCKKLGKMAEGLDFPPYPGEIGKKIFEEISKEAWEAWLIEQTKLVNEMRLNLGDPKARAFLAKEAYRYFFGETDA